MKLEMIHFTNRCALRKLGLHRQRTPFISMTDHAIERIEARILDIPTIRPHKLSFGAIQRQSPVIVQVFLRGGATGYGEAATIGGASWNEGSPESILHAVEHSLAPALLGQDGARFEWLLDRMDRACRGNLFAKAAVEMAVIDAVARAHGLPAWQLLGGKLHDRLPLAWTLASGHAEQDVHEAQTLLAQGRNAFFKIKIGARAPADDVAHVGQIARALRGSAPLTVDVNQAWDGHTARLHLPALVDAGVRLIEQPVARWNLPALKDLSAQLTGALVMADESVCTPFDAMALAAARACHVFSLKVAKHGGLLRTREVAAIARAADIGWYGGTMLETSIGSAASAHVFATLPGTHYCCELFGPQLLVEDVVTQPMAREDGALLLPDGPGFGIEVDVRQLDLFDRRRARPLVIDMGARA